MKTRLAYLLTPLLVFAVAGAALAQGTAFTYQGRLNDGASAANGMYDLQFAIYSLESGGLAVAGPFVKSPISVSNGLFTVTLDFGAGVFTGAERWLEVGVQTNGGGGFATLVPRQKFTATPYAITASNLTGVVSSAGLSGTYSGAVTFNNPTSSFSGNGGSLTNVNALTLGKLGSSDFWRLDGNNVSGSQFLGTTNNQALEIRVNNTRALRIEPHSVPSLIGGYYENSAGGVAAAVIAGGGTSGSINQVLGNYAFVGAGHGAKAGEFSAVVGGAYNVSPGQFSFIGSGLANTNQGIGSAVVGGTNNFVAALADNAFVGGGHNNIANNTHATVAGGELNVASSWSAVGGGRGNQSGGAYSTVAGGRGNQSMGTYASAGGGYANISSGDHATVAGGYLNVSGSADSMIGGGSNNTIRASSDGSAIGGGRINLIQTNSISATIAGGEQNNIDANAFAASIGGGQFNLIQANSALATIAGGKMNSISGQLATIAGGYANTIESGASASFIADGFENSIQSDAKYCAIGGGFRNTIGIDVYNSTIGGGFGNTIIGPNGADSTIGGGDENTIGSTAWGSVIGGGRLNTIGTNAHYAVIGGGFYNTIGDNADSSMIAGGYLNLAAGIYSFAAGRQAQALHQGAFVWADSQNAPFASTANNQFSIRAAGGVRLNTDTSLIFGSTSSSMLGPDQGGAIELGDSTASATTPYIDFHYGVGTAQDFNVRIANDGNGLLTIGRAGFGIAMAQFSPAGLTVNGAVVLTSDRNQKENFQPVDAGEVLAKVVALPLTRWNFKQDTCIAHIGPMAQDFYAAFGVGPDDKHIATVDADGVALAAIQGLNQKLEEQRADLKQKDTEITELKQKLERLETTLSGALDKTSRGRDTHTSGK